MSKKNRNHETTKESKVPNMDYSPNLSPSAARLREAGYGKSMDLELAKTEENQAVEENQSLNTGLNMRNDSEMNTAGTNDTQPNQNFELGNLETQNNQENNLNNDALQNTGYTGELTNYKTNEFEGIANQPEHDFEFGDLNPKNKYQSGKKSK